MGESHDSKSSLYGSAYDVKSGPIPDSRLE